MNPSEAMRSELSITVVIPTWRRSEILRATLNSLSEDARTRGGDAVQVVVVCDGNDAGTLELAESYVADSLAMEWVFHNENLGLPSARNTGAIRAKGDLLLFLDDDAEAAPGLLCAHVAAHLQAEAKEADFHYVACGRIMESARVKQSSRTGEFVEQSWMFTLARHEAAIRAGETDPQMTDALTNSYFGLNCSIRRDLFAETGGFNPMLRWMDEELEYGARLYMRGVRFLSTPAMVYHRNDKDLVAYFCRCWGLGGACDTLRAIKLGQHNPQTRNLLKMDTGPVLEQLANRAFWYGHRPGRRIGEWLRWLTERTGSRLAFRLWHDTERLSRYWEAVQEFGTGRAEMRELAGEPVRVLILHSIAAPQNAGEGMYYLSPARFRMLLDRMREGGYRCADPIKLEDADGSWGPRELVLTFDDGYDDFYREVFPLMTQYGLKPLVFLVAERIGDSNRWDHNRGLRKRKLLNADQIKELQRYGVRFGSHSLTHPSLPELNAVELRRELTDSKHRLEDLLGEKVSMFAYPFGEANRRVRAAVVEAGYKFAFTTVEGLNSWQDPFAMLRTEVNESVAPWSYGWKLATGVSPLQSLKVEVSPLLRMIPRELRGPFESALEKWRAGQRTVS
ncbi:polysaccharide deacetylase family protein [Telmatobacter sp. DSM 110680]|uniref:Polysaccharide deacetylase family protein n=1 Tax=Telmatobacter sp. DSM 110680 TaxID=3036704 RepID=A0AAU7DEZ1_9BACT